MQAAGKLVLEPIFEADLDPSAYGYRPKRGGLDAIKEVHTLLCRGYTDVVDADLAKYFDTIPHRELIKSVARRIVDRNVLRLAKMWLKTPVEERDEQGKRRMSGGRHSTCGTPQGGVVSPMLANVYMNRFLKYWRQSGRNAAYRAHVVSYADDFVILSRGYAEEAKAWTGQVMDRLGLTLNEAKTSVRDTRREVRLSWVYVRAALLSEEWSMVPGREPVEEECATHQGQGRRDPGSRKSRAVVRGVRSAEQPAARLALLLRLRFAPASLRGG